MRFVFHFASGIIRDVTMRRWTMFLVVLVALVLLFAGSTFFAAALEKRPFVFLAYWGACAWLTLLAILLAAYDLLMVRAHARRERRRLRKDVFGDEEK